MGCTGGVQGPHGPEPGGIEDTKEAHQPYFGSRASWLKLPAHLLVQKFSWISSPLFHRVGWATGGCHEKMRAWVPMRWSVTLKIRFGSVYSHLVDAELVGRWFEARKQPR